LAHGAKRSGLFDKTFTRASDGAFTLGVTMKVISARALLAVVLATSGCTAYQLNHLPDSSSVAGPVPISASGAFLHQPSEFMFPERILDFQRISLLRYDSQGLNVSGGYNEGSAACLIRRTIYVYPAPRMQFIGASPDVVRSLETQWLNNAYGQSKAEITSSHPSAELLVESPITDRSSPGIRGTFVIATDLSDVEIYLVKQTWFVKYRHTYPRACETEAKSALARFHEQLKWPSNNMFQATLPFRVSVAEPGR
jgi:hypothetical protein